MAKEYKAVLFDLDGTLIDTSPGIFNGLDYMMPLMGKEKKDDQTKSKVIGPALEDTFGPVLGFAPDEIAEAIRVYRTYNNEQGYKEFKYYPGMDELIDYLAGKDYRIFVVTMKEDGVAQLTIKATGYMDKLDKVVGNSDMDAKTKAQLILSTLSDYGIEPEEALLIGDTSIDAQGAQEAHVDFYPAMFGFGFSHKDDSEEFPYIQKLFQPTDLIKILERKEDRNGTC